MMLLQHKPLFVKEHSNSGCVHFLPTDISPTFWFTSHVAGRLGYLEAKIGTEWLISYIEKTPRKESIPVRKDFITSKVEYLRYESIFMQFYSSSSSAFSPSMGHRGKVVTNRSKSG